jgi:putative membrane protein
MQILMYWPFEPVVLLGVELASVAYVVGGIGLRPDRRRAVAFWAALVTILIALQSPIDVYARQLFWVHMVQHLLLIVVAAPLLALASPWNRMWRALPKAWRRAIAHPLFRSAALAPVRRVFHLAARPRVIWVVAAVNLWLWHVPTMYDLTLRNHTVHHLEHALFLGLGIAFWACVFDQHPFRSPLGQVERIAFVFGAMAQSFVLAAVLVFANTPFYAYSLLPWRPGGLSALNDQQVGGGVMWVPGAIPYAIILFWFLFRWLENETRSESTAGVAGN